MTAVLKGILINVLLAMILTTASAAQECIRTLPAKRDVHWYYYVRKSDGARCWFPGSQSTRAVNQDAGPQEPKQGSQSKLVIKPVPATAALPVRKTTNAAAPKLINAAAPEPEPAAPATPAEIVGRRWPAPSGNSDRTTARREVPPQHREQ